MSDKALSAIRGPITIALMMATFMNSLDATVINVALPHMQGSLSASPEQITWVITSYIVASAVMTPVSGWLAGRLGLKRMLLTAIAGFTAASILCGAATLLPEMVVFRVLQGIFGAALVPLSQAVLLNINPPERHARAMATWSTATILGPVAGPALGGYLTEQFSWRWCFYINVPVGVLAILLLVLFMPGRTTTHDRRFDFLGFGALSLGIGCLQLLLDRGPGQDWFASREAWIEAVIAAMGFWVFFTHTLTSGRPLFDPSLARDRNLISATGFVFFTSLLMFSSLTLLPLLMQSVLGYSASFSGLVSMPRGLTMMVTMLMAGRLAGRVDLRFVIGAGLAICTVAFWQMAQFDLTMGVFPVAFSGLVQGIGQGMIFVPLSTLAFATVAPALRAEASSIYNLLRMLGGSIGIAVMQGMAAANGQAAHAALAARIVSSDPLVRAGLPAAMSPDTVAGALALNAEINRQAVMIAYLDDFRLMVVVAVLSLPLLLLLRPQRRTAPVPARA